MTDQTQFLLNQAIVAIRAGDLDGGRKLLESVLETDPKNENAWLWMSAAVSTDDERRHCLQQILNINPDNAQAKRGMEKLGPPPSAAEETENLEAELGDMQDLMADFAAFDQSEGEQAGQPAPGDAAGYTWALEPEQRDLASEAGTGEVDLEALFKSFDEASEAAESEAQVLEWDFDKAKAGKAPAAGEQALSGEEALDRFLGVEPSVEDKRGFYEEDARRGKAVPAFTFDEDSEKVLEAAESGGGEVAFITDEGTGAKLGTQEAGAMAEEGEEQMIEGLRSPLAPGELTVWANPGGKANSVIILRDEYLILANPDPLFVPRILDEAEKGEVKKKSLGRTAIAIRLKDIELVEGELEDTGFVVTYRTGNKHYTANAEFDTIKDRDDAMQAITTQLGIGFRMAQVSLKRFGMILTPILLMVLALIATPLLAYLSTMYLGMPTSFTELTPALIVPLVVGVLGALLFAIGLIWLIAKLRRPLRKVRIEPADELGL